MLFSSVTRGNPGIYNNNIVIWREESNSQLACLENVTLFCAIRTPQKQG